MWLFCSLLFYDLVFPGGSTGKESTCNVGDPSSISWLGKIPWRRDSLPTPVFSGFPGGSDGKESSCNVGDLSLIPGLGRSPGGGHRNPLQYSCLENLHGQRSLVGYSPRGRKESDTTEWLCIAQHILWFSMPKLSPLWNTDVSFIYLKY